MQFFPYFIGILTVVFLVMQFYPYFKLKAARGKNAPSTGNVLNDAQQQSSRLLYYFMSPRCGMCKNITPIVDELIEERHDVIRIDASKDQQLARSFGVLGTPAFVLVDNGVIEKVKLGGMNKKNILKMLDAPND